MKKQVFKKVFCFVLMLSLLVGTFITSAQAETQYQTTPNNLRELLISLMEKENTPAVSDAKGKFVDILDTIDNTQNYNISALAVETQKIMKSLEINADIPLCKNALEKYAQFKGPDYDPYKMYVRKLIQEYTVPKYNYSFNGFKGIVKTINGEVTGEFNKDDGFRLVIGLLDYMCAFAGEPVAHDLNGDINKIDLSLEDHNTIKGIFGTTVKMLGIYEEYLKNKKNSEIFDAFMGRTADFVNLLHQSEVVEFKKFLEFVNPGIYEGKVKYIPNTPLPTSPPIQPSTVVNTPTPTVSASVTATATATATTKPTATPTALPGTKRITSFSFKGLNPEVNGVIYEQVHTIFVKVPFGTDVKDLEPTIEYQGASIQPESGKKKNFSHPVFYTVTAQDKSKARYVVIVYFGLDTVLEEPKPVVPGAGPYGDAYNHWAENQILSLVEQGLVTGYPDGSVKPNAEMTRAEVVTLLVKALGLTPADKPKLDFKDAKDIPAWAQGYVQVGIEKGFITGYEDKTFRASKKVTRQELAVMAMKAFAFAELKDKNLKFKDAKEVAAWAIGYVAKAVEDEIIMGYEDNTFRPKNNITRAEVFAIIDRCLAKKAK